MRKNFSHYFLLDPDIVFLNHGSFGATPQPVFAAYQTWQRRLENQPVHFIVDELPAHLARSRHILGEYVNAKEDDLVYIPNATFGMNVVARSLVDALALGAEDEVLTTNHEYGACDNVWRYLSQKRGFRYKHQPLPLPAMSPQAVADQFWAGVTAQTRVIFLSHITSFTALRLPVEMICQRARQAGILTVIDGAHAPGQIPLDLTVIDADFYFGNAHKWLCAPKGAAFLYVRRDQQRHIQPLIVGWGWGENRTETRGSDFLDYMEWLGTDDLSSYLAVPDAIAFQAAHDWTAVRADCHELLNKALAQVSAITGTQPPYGDTWFYQQMAGIPLPPIADLPAFKRRLYEAYRIEIPCISWEDWQFIRISVQGYNTEKDIDRLVAALAELLPQVTSI